MYVADGQVFGKAKHVQAVQEEGSHNSATNTWQPMFRVHDYKQAQTTTPDAKGVPTCSPALSPCTGWSRLGWCLG
jgi:hypothetical protein